jgi:hypothetical protein
MKKLDLKKEHKRFYNIPRKVQEVKVPKFKFLSIEGMNAEIDNPAFQEAIQALYAVSFKAKFMCKQQLNRDYVVMPLEGLWWADDMDDFKRKEKKNWHWQLMVFQPDFVSQEIIKEAKAIQYEAKKLDSILKTELIEFEESTSVQILHIGPYEDEDENIELLHKEIENLGGSFDGQVQKHHEIYLNDFRRVDPSKLKTIIRQPFKPENG